MHPTEKIVIFQPFCNQYVLSDFFKSCLCVKKFTIVQLVNAKNSSQNNDLREPRNRNVVQYTRLIKAVLLKVTGNILFIR